jgi:hypothetical protein
MMIVVAGADDAQDPHSRADRAAGGRPCLFRPIADFSREGSGRGIGAEAFSFRVGS